MKSVEKNSDEARIGFFCDSSRFLSSAISYEVEPFSPAQIRWKLDFQKTRVIDWISIRQKDDAGYWIEEQKAFRISSSAAWFNKQERKLGIHPKGSLLNSAQSVDAFL